MTARRAPIFVVAVGVLGSQAGHLLAYQARFGTLAPRLQSSNAHAYFPLVAKTGLGIAAALLLGALLMIGAAKMLGHRQIATHPTGFSFLSLVAALYTIQLACFAGQETLEAALSGAPATSAAVLLLWGTLGQLPVAALSAVALRWLMAEFEAAVQEIRASLHLIQPQPEPVPAVALLPPVAVQRSLIYEVVSSGHNKRGPPSLLRFSL
ncbi:MAG: hypothetical protein ACHQ0J_12600 [Candidatus Dormibacterales bacterium]